MADITISQAERNSKGTYTENAGAASQTVDLDNVPDESIVFTAQNGDALPCRVKIATDGYGGEDADDIDIDLSAGGTASFSLESMYVKAPSTQKATITIVDQDDTAFSGTVTNVVLTAIRKPKGVNA